MHYVHVHVCMYSRSLCKSARVSRASFRYGVAMQNTRHVPPGDVCTTRPRQTPAGITTRITTRSPSDTRDGTHRASRKRVCACVCAVVDSDLGLRAAVHYRAFIARRFCSVLRSRYCSPSRAERIARILRIRLKIATKKYIFFCRGRGERRERNRLTKKFARSDATNCTRDSGNY